MKIEPAVKQRIVKNVLLSIFIYFLPLALMFVSFYISGQRPWEHQPKGKQPNQSQSSLKLNQHDPND
ncbi:hypothetical protein C8P68_101700 [Mucilaginibacter yixingensis]|uniref:Uncharacterized protein n=1 Tax=Mucilaginibacter yixingensis TaxID=1295612 RepID=A0A2T5JGI1_9SPHI|nr:hypothetical protein [Mucilaginibacter yixingensis]PTR01466.1 hypothetical protein C8P68_101700 [Mucilaginibacter yixingensis]